MVYIYIFAMPAAEAYRGEKPFAYAVRDRIGDGTAQLGLFRTVGPLFYIDPPKPLAEFNKPKDLANAVARRQDRMGDRAPARSSRDGAAGRGAR